MWPCEAWQGGGVRAPASSLHRPPRPLSPAGIPLLCVAPSCPRSLLERGRGRCCPASLRSLPEHLEVIPRTVSRSLPGTEHRGRGEPLAATDIRLRRSHTLFPAFGDPKPQAHLPWGAAASSRGKKAGGTKGSAGFVLGCGAAPGSPGTGVLRVICPLTAPERPCRPSCSGRADAGVKAASHRALALALAPAPPRPPGGDGTWHAALRPAGCPGLTPLCVPQDGSRLDAPNNAWPSRVLSSSLSPAPSRESSCVPRAGGCQAR